MTRTSIRPYEEITVLSLANIATGTKFQCFCKIKGKEEAFIIVSDDKSHYELALNEEKFVDIEIGDTVLVFGQKEESGMELEKIIKLNLDWPLFVKTGVVEHL